MSTQTLTAEHERAINETLLHASGLAAEGYEIGVAGNLCRYPKHNGDDGDVREPFTRSLDSLRLVEERLDDGQWREYMLEISKRLQVNRTVEDAADLVISGFVDLLRLSSSLRAAALAEVVQS